MVYAVSDIHGEFGKFMDILEKISFSDSDMLYILGDVIDRGPEPIKTLQFIMKQKNMELLLGNHEDMMLHGFNDSRHFELWMYNGGYVTKSQLDSLSSSERLELVEYLKSRSLYKILGNYILVHSGVNPYRLHKDLSVEEKMKMQTRDELLWSREEFYQYPALDGYIIIFGHTPTPFLYKECDNILKKPFCIWHDRRHNDKIGIDCGAFVESGRLACLCLDNLTEFYSA